jgi:hypothetical protein
MLCQRVGVGMGPRLCEVFWLLSVVVKDRCLDAISPACWIGFEPRFLWNVVIQVNIDTRITSWMSTLISPLSKVDRLRVIFLQLICKCIKIYTYINQHHIYKHPG